jgi:hypothetical protein
MRLLVAAILIARVEFGRSPEKWLAVGPRTHAGSSLRFQQFGHAPGDSFDRGVVGRASLK